MSLRETAAKIRDMNRFVISGNTRLDGDAVGSGLAMYHLLRGMGKDVIVANQSEIPSHYLFVPGSEQAHASYRTVPQDRECMITVDTPDVSRAEILGGRFPDSTYIVNIDHHRSNHLYGNLNWIDDTAAAVGEMIYDLVQELRQPVTRELATALYVSIVTDTGRFGFGQTTERTHRIAADLHKAGIDIQQITREIYQSKSPGEFKLLGRTAQSLQLLAEGRLAIISLTPKDFEDCECGVEESQPFVEVGLGIKGVQMAMFLRVPAAGMVKVSFRSKHDKIDVNEFAKGYGGGGHKKAAGLTVPGDLNTVHAALTQAAESFVRQSLR